MPEAKPHGLPRERRLLRSNDFARVERQGRRASGALLTIVARHGRSRVGFAVSKKVGNAVVRNTIKRRLREILRRNKELFAGKDVVVIAAPAAAGKSSAELEQDLRDALARVGPLDERHHGKTRPRR